MDLIIKPTIRCNFFCEFCSSTEFCDKDSKDLTSQDVINILKQEHVNSIVFNGGDPLLMEPEFYWDIVHYIHDNNLSTTLSMTTNLKDFMKNPDKWTPLFTQEIVPVGVCTSFQYGSLRKIYPNQPYTEEMFRETFKKFYEYTGQKLAFLAIISEENEKYALKHVEFAKELGTQCRINEVINSGKAGKPYPFYKIANFWVDIIKAGDDKYEMNCAVFKDAVDGVNTECPFCRSCTDSVMCLSCGSPDKLTRCGSLSDDIPRMKDDPEEQGLLAYTLGEAEDVPYEYSILKPECYSCPMYQVCNACFKTNRDLRKFGMVDEHCKGIKKVYKRIQKLKAEGKW